MFLVGLLQWWYGQGWVSQRALFKDHLSRTASFFSVGQLALTLFSPFRQISVGRVEGSISVQLRALFDVLLSRCIGAIVRGTMIIVGILVIIVRAIIEGIVLGVWFLVPALPIVGFALLAIGWVPQWI